MKKLINKFKSLVGIAPKNELPKAFYDFEEKRKATKLILDHHKNNHRKINIENDRIAKNK